MNLKSARETVESHLRWLSNRPEQWEPQPLPMIVQEALCLLALRDDGTREVLGDVFRDGGPTIITPETPSGTGDGW